MALLMVLLTVLAMLGGISLLLWLSVVVESRHLGPAPAPAAAVVADVIDQALDIVDEGAVPAPHLAPLQVEAA